MQTLKKAIKNAVKESGIDKALKQESAVFLWKEIVGKTVSTVTDAKKVENGVLLIKTQSPTWRQELYMQKKDIDLLSRTSFPEFYQLIKLLYV